MKIVPFKTSADFRNWLEKNHTNVEGIWMRLYKKASGRTSITYAEALDHALCFGWIDGQKKSHDELSWIQKFTPRRAKSGWSQRNTEHVERLILAGLMMPPGQKVVDEAKVDGRWATAYVSPRNALPPEDFLAALEKNKKAKAFFATLNKANIYSIVYRLQTAKKPETREKRMTAILAMLTEGKPFHPLFKKRE